MTNTESEFSPTVLPTSDTAPTIGPRGALAAIALREGPGTRIGLYKLVEQLGEGGFGSVFLAEQEKPVRRQVALKIIKLGMDTTQVIARFEQERQTLAILDHPHIAKVLDAGATDTGRPYFVMELCQGDPITDYCVKNNLEISQRLDLFLQVCLAVQHAHTKGIIHRDLKPGNILVRTQDGVPHAKVIDFGIAKATAGGSGENARFTEERQLIGTPEYMSPEQAEGSLDIDTRTDVYALGVVLYELLTGTTPLESQTLRSAGISGIPRLIRELEPPKPSTRLSSLSLAPAAVANVANVSVQPITRQHRHAKKARLRTIRRDLDWIVMKALEKDRARRYETANGLAMDIRRYLAGEAVVAAPPSTAYRVRKFVNRHKLGVTAAVLVALALALGIATTSVAMVKAMNSEARAVSEADRANRQAETSQEALHFLVGLFAVVDPSEARGNTITAREILDKGAARIEADLSSQPQAQATLMDTMGTVYRSLGLYDAAEPLFKKALAQRRALFVAPSAEIAETLNSYANLLVKKGEFDEAEPMCREALEMRQAVFGEDHEAVAETLNDLASLLSQKGEFAKAEPMYRKALDMRRRLLGPESKAAAETLHNLAICVFNQGDVNAPVPLLESALAIRRKLFGEVHPDVAESLNSLALVLYSRGELDRATPLFREALDVQKRLVGNVHPDVAMAMNNLAFVLHDSGDFDAAETIYREVLEVQHKLLGDDHPDIAKVLNNLAAVLHDKGDIEQAVKYARDSLAMYRRVDGDEHPDVAQGLNNLARWLQEKGDLSEAESMFREALAMRRKLLGEKHPAVAVTLTGLANLLVETKRYDEALQLASEARTKCAAALSEKHWRTAVADSVVGAALSGLGRFDEAEPLLLSSYQRLQNEKGAVIYFDDARRRLIDLYEAWHKPDAAAKYRTPPAANPQVGK